MRQTLHVAYRCFGQGKTMPQWHRGGATEAREGEMTRSHRDGTAASHVNFRQRDGALATRAAIREATTRSAWHLFTACLSSLPLVEAAAAR